MGRKNSRNVKVGKENDDHGSVYVFHFSFYPPFSKTSFHPGGGYSEKFSRLNWTRANQTGEKKNLEQNSDDDLEYPRYVSTWDDVVLSSSKK